MLAPTSIVHSSGILLLIANYVQSDLQLTSSNNTFMAVSLLSALIMSH